MKFDAKDAEAAASAVKTAVDAMKAVYSIFQSRRFRKREKEQLQREAEKLLSLATDDQVDRYVANPRRVTIDRKLSAVKRKPATGRRTGAVRRPSRKLSGTKRVSAKPNRRQSAERSSNAE